MHVRFSELMASRPVYECRTYLGMFGHGSAKPTKLLSDDPFVCQLARSNLGSKRIDPKPMV